MGAVLLIVILCSLVILVVKGPVPTIIVLASDEESRLKAQGRGCWDEV